MLCLASQHGNTATRQHSRSPPPPWTPLEALPRVFAARVAGLIPTSRICGPLSPSPSPPTLCRAIDSSEDQPENGKTQVPLKILIVNELIGHIIGKGGSTIKQLSDDSGTEIQINQPDSQPGPETLRIVTVEGSAVGLCEAQKLVVGKLLNVRKSIEQASGSRRQSSSKNANSGSALYGASAFPLLGGRSERNIVLVLESMIGSVIGRQGVHAKEITKVSNAKIHIETRDEKETRQEDEADEESGADERQIVVMGNPDCQFKAQHLIYQRLQDEDRKNNNRKERRMKVHFPVQSTMLGRVIGKGGAKIKELAATSGARLKLLRYEDEQEEDDTIIEIFGSFQEVRCVDLDGHDLWSLFPAGPSA